MRTMTCKQLGGACDQKFTANTFEEIAALSKKHGAEMFQKKDIGHIRAMEIMKSRMPSPESFQQWFEAKKEEFETLPED